MWRSLRVKRLALDMKMESVLQDPSSFEWVRGKTPLSSPKWLLGAWMVYPVVVLSFKHFAGKRERGFSNSGKLTSFSAVHNLWLAIWSLIMFVGANVELYRYVASEGLKGVFCTLSSSRVPNRIYYWMYIFYISKFYELIDTVIIVARKRELTLLHVWHHSSVIFETWLWIDQGWTHASIGVWFNTLVHIFMYSYFCASILKIKVPWRKHITQLQIVQFISSFVLTIPHLVLQIQSGWKCSGRTALYASVFFNMTYLILFIRFYATNYRTSKSKTG
ncbi:hypothetical protein NDN08_003680 [Rhodosorus marinus]|uniref:Elongation of fatty acids protein n=1 Tax=Rhodosorus marinus TaxID=101924 RepID=A0AAV8UXH7_9RHOD|nr:hypothetical protein NDN08_003680 [Rhodosorus marinus]